MSGAADTSRLRDLDLGLRGLEPTVELGEWLAENPLDPFDSAQRRAYIELDQARTLVCVAQDLLASALALLGA